MNLEFRPLRLEDYALAEAFKRATVVSVTGNDALFEAWFGGERTFSSHLDTLLMFDPASCAQLLVDGVVAGEIDLMKLHDNCGLLNNIYLLPEWRGKGLGEAMDAYAVAFFKRHNLPKAILRTHPGNPKVVAFYERMGWTYSGEARHGMVEMSKEIE